MSRAVVYRSDARFASAFRQIRSSSLGMRVVDLPGRAGLGRGDLLQDLRQRVAPERPFGRSAARRRRRPG